MPQKLVLRLNVLTRICLLLVFPISMGFPYAYVRGGQSRLWESYHLFEEWADLVLYVPIMIGIALMLIFRGLYRYKIMKILIVCLAGVHFLGTSPLLVFAVQDFVPDWGAVIPFAAFPLMLALLLGEWSADAEPRKEVELQIDQTGT